MIDAYRRTAFIKAHISFIVPDSQIYLPFMGTCLEEKYRMEIQSTETLQPSTQLLLFYWYYAKENCIYMHGAVKALGCSAMTITRAFRQLEKTGCFETGKTGVQKYLKGKCTPDEILRMLKSSLSSPVADVLYIDKEIARKSIRSDLSDGEVRGDKDRSLIIVSTDEEKGYPCKDHKEAYDLARERGLFLTAHAGEDDSDQNVKDAIEILHVQRIDHGCAASENPELMKYMEK